MFDLSDDWHARCLTHLAELEDAAERGESLERCLDTWSKLCVEAGAAIDSMFLSHSLDPAAIDYADVSPFARTFLALLRGLELPELLDRCKH